MYTRVSVRVLVAVVAMLLAGKIVSAQNSTPNPVKGLTVVDANGKRVGNVLGFTNVGPSMGQTLLARPVVSFRGQSTVFVMGVLRNSFIPVSFGTVEDALYFQSANCTGTPYWDIASFTNDLDPLIPLSILNQNKVYEQIGSATALSIGSTFWLGNCELWGGLPQLSARELRLAVDLSTFTPPFTVR